MVGILEVNAQVLLDEVQRLRALHAAGKLPNKLTTGAIWHAETLVRDAAGILRSRAPLPALFTW